MNFRELEEAMMKDLLEKSDIHKRRASKIFDVPYEEVTLAQRRIAKMIGFGIDYGMRPYRIRQEFNSKQSLKDKEEV